MASSIKIEGLSELLKGLEEFKKSTSRGILERAVKRAAKPVMETAKALAPVDTGELKKSITMKVIRNSAGKVAYADVMRGGGSAEEAAAAAHDANRAAKAAGNGPSALVRVQASAPHAHFSEFGTQHSAPQPFMGPAYLEAKQDVPRSIATDLKIEMEKSARRIAARAAKKGTK